MLKKSIVIAFLSILVASPVLAAKCTADLPDDDNRRYWQVWFRRTYWQPCNSGNSHFVVSDRTVTRDWATSYLYRFTTPFTYNSVSFESETVSAEGWFLKKDCVGDSVPFNPTFQRFTIVKRRHYDNRIIRNDTTAVTIEAEIRPFRPGPGVDPTPIKVNCPPPPDDDDDECPNLNLRITGSILPARRGTARISGDWCK